MKKLLPVLIICLFACHSAKKNYKRFFFVSYRTQVIDSSETYGNRWFSYTGMPPMKAIDSIIAVGLERERKCYKQFIITQLMEFYNESDFKTFIGDYSGNLDTAKVKKGCCCAPWNWDIQLGGPLRIDTNLSGDRVIHIDKVGTLNQH